MHNVKLQRLFQSRINKYLLSIYIKIFYNVEVLMFIVFYTPAKPKKNKRKILHYKWLKCRYDQ